MDWDLKEKERRKAEDEERARLIAMTDGEAESLPVPIRYQRIRYLREIEAAKWLEDIRRKLPSVQPDRPMTRRYAKKNTKIIYNQD